MAGNSARRTFVLRHQPQQTSITSGLLSKLPHTTVVFLLSDSESERTYLYAVEAVSFQSSCPADHVADKRSGLTIAGVQAKLSHTAVTRSKLITWLLHRF